MVKIIVAGLVASLTGLSLMHSALMTAGTVALLSLLIIHGFRTDYS